MHVCDVISNNIWPKRSLFFFFFENQVSSKILPEHFVAAFIFKLPLDHGDYTTRKSFQINVFSQSAKVR